MSQYIWRYNTLAHAVVEPTGRQAINDKGLVIAEVEVKGEKMSKALWAPSDELYLVMGEHKEVIQ